MAFMGNLLLQIQVIILLSNVLLMKELMEDTPLTLLFCIPCTTKQKTVEVELHDGDPLLRDRKLNLSEVKKRIKFQACKHRIEREFQHGDMAYLRLQPFQ